MIDETTLSRQQELERRVRELAAEVQGEKYVTRHVFEQDVFEQDVFEQDVFEQDVFERANLNADDLTALTTNMRHVKGEMFLIKAVLTSQAGQINNLVQDVGALRHEMTAPRRDVVALRTEMDAKFDALRMEMNAKFDAVLTAVRGLAPRGEG
jgi:hypothetical protein